MNQEENSRQPEQPRIGHTAQVVLNGIASSGATREDTDRIKQAAIAKAIAERADKVTAQHVLDAWDEQRRPEPNSEKTGGLTEQEWKDLGSAEANAWTITPAGTNTPMSLTELAEHRAAEQQAKAEEAKVYGQDEHGNATPDQMALNSQEFGQTTYIIGGVPMTAAQFDAHIAKEAKEKAESRAAVEASMAYDAANHAAWHEEMNAKRAAEAKAKEAQELARGADIAPADVPRWTEAELDELSRVGPEDAKDSAIQATPKLRDLLDAD